MAGCIRLWLIRGHLVFLRLIAEVNDTIRRNSRSSEKPMQATQNRPGGKANMNVWPGQQNPLGAIYFSEIPELVEPFEAKARCLVVVLRHAS